MGVWNSIAQFVHRTACPCGVDTSIPAFSPLNVFVFIRHTKTCQVEIIILSARGMALSHKNSYVQQIYIHTHIHKYLTNLIWYLQESKILLSSIIINKCVAMFKDTSEIFLMAGLSNARGTINYEFCYYVLKITPHTWVYYWEITLLQRLPNITITLCISSRQWSKHFCIVWGWLTWKV